MARKVETTEERAKKTKELSESYRENVFFPYNGEGILNLIDEKRWPNIALADQQKDILKKMHRLVRETNKAFSDSTADYLETNPSDYQQYMDLCGKRLSASVIDAKRLVKFGLLTQDQTDYYIHKTYSQDLTSPLSIIASPTSHELFGITEEQYEQYEQADRDANIKQSKLSLMSGDETASGKLRRIKEEREAVCASMFTSEQYEMWERLRGERAKPDVPKSLSTPESLVDLTTISDVFQTLSDAETNLDVTSRQKNLLKEFEVVVQQGLHWIGERSKGPFPAGDARNDSLDPVGQTQEVFMTHVDRFVLLAILTPQQAEMVDPNIHHEM